jgi:hypothetical protein
LPNVSAWVTVAVAARLAEERIKAAAARTSGFMVFSFYWDEDEAVRENPK